MRFLKSYFTIEESREVYIEKNTNPAVFQNVKTTISEVNPIPMEEVFRRVLSNPILGWIGFMLFFVLVVLRWRKLLPFVPMLALGLMSFKSSNRFVMYLAPFIGIGLGLLLNHIIETIFLSKFREFYKIYLFDGFFIQTTIYAI